MMDSQTHEVIEEILNLNHSQITHVLLYDDSSLKNETNTEILNSTMNYTLSTRRFEGSNSSYITVLKNNMVLFDTP